MRHIIIYFVVIMLLGCTQEEVTPRKYPRVLTHSPLFQGSQIILYGEISYYASDAPIIDHGFIWTSYPTASYDTWEKISLGPRDATGVFKAEADLPLFIENSIKAYAQTQTQIIYGNVRVYPDLTK